jgi:hypothetical protein
MELGAPTMTTDDQPPTAPSVPDLSAPPADGDSERFQPVIPFRFNNFFARNWRGEYPLWVSYWVFGALGNAIMIAIGVVAARALSVDTDFEPRAIFSFYVVIWLGVLGIACWQCVGVWRSADRRIRERRRLNRRAPWAFVAKGVLILGVLQLTGTFAMSGLPQIMEAIRMAFLGDPDMPAYAIRVMRSGSEAEITGGFKYGLTEDVLKVLRASPQIRVVHLNSVGGRIGEAVKMNEVIRDRGLVTYVSAQCLSACMVAFAGGRERWLRQGSLLGFHRPAFPGMSERELADSVALQQKIFAAAGFDARFVGRAFATPNTDMWTPSGDELLRARVITAVSNGNDFAASGLGSDEVRAAMERIVFKYWPALRTMRWRFADDYAPIVEMFHENYMAGRTENEVMSEVRRRAVAAISTYRPFADDAVLMGLAKLVAEQYSALSAKDPTQCPLYAFGANGTRDFTSYFPEGLVERQRMLDERVFATATERPQVTRETTARLWRQIFAHLSEKGFDAERRKLLLSSTGDPASSRAHCAMIVALMHEVIGLEQSDAAMVMRQLLRRQ